MKTENNQQTPDAVREALEQLQAAEQSLSAIKAQDAILAALDSREGEDVRPDSWAAAPEEVRERAQLLADVELHLKLSRIFITTREKMHPCGVELHDELLGRVTAAIDSIGKAKGHD